LLQDISVPEAFALDEFDQDAMKREYAAANKTFSSSNVPEEKAEAYIQLTTIQELSRAMGMNL
jgi:F0F1-type ATP synthase epsilon subunit